MKTILVILLGAICFWISALFAILASIEAALAVVAILMMTFDHGFPVQDHDWAPTSAIHGIGFLITAAIALFGFVLTRLFLKANWWKFPLQQGVELATTQTITAFGVLMILSALVFHEACWCLSPPFDVELIRSGAPILFAIIGLCLSFSGMISLIARNRKAT